MDVARGAVIEVDSGDRIQNRDTTNPGCPGSS